MPLRLALILCCALAAPALAVDSILMPIEVKGASLHTETVRVVVPGGGAATATKLFVLAHNLSYETKGSVKVGTDEWVQLSDANVDLVTDATLGYPTVPASHGGIGGAMTVVAFTVPFTPGAIVDGLNEVKFRFNVTDGHTSGWTVLEFNLWTDANAPVLPKLGETGSQFREQNPRNFATPMPATPANLAAGAALYTDADLLGTEGTPILAKCADCHVRDAGDLKYFNYSPKSIVAQSELRGLSELEAKQLATWVLSTKSNDPDDGLDYASPYARPWNPAYQPGPGLDSRHVRDWAAGAGYKWILPEDRDTFRYIYGPNFPSVIDWRLIRTSHTLNVRETPVALQMLDWNQWLPRYWPGDSYGSDWLNHNARKFYDGSGTGLAPNTPGGAANTAATYNWRTRFTATPSWLTAPTNKTRVSEWGEGWGLAIYNFVFARTDTVPDTATPQANEQIYAVRQWHLVKSWEMFQEFGLEDEGDEIYDIGTHGGVANSTKPAAWSEDRTWPTGDVFRTGPFQMRLPANENGILGNATDKGLIADTISNQWYHLQLVLNAAHRQQDETSPIDWPYNTGKMSDLLNPANSLGATAHRSPGSGRGEVARMHLWNVKGLQGADNGLGVANWQRGWTPDGRHWRIFGANYFPFEPEYWADYTTDERVRITEAEIRAWFEVQRTFTRANMMVEGWVGTLATNHPYAGAEGATPPGTDSTDTQELCSKAGATNGSDVIEATAISVGQKLYVMLGKWETLGVSNALRLEIIAYAETVWTNASNNWAQFAD